MQILYILFRLGEFSVTKFTKRIEQLGFEKFPEFSKYGKMTFFLPIDQAFGVSNNISLCIMSYMQNMILYRSLELSS